MITILTGDKVSSGDALIVNRGVRLLNKLLPEQEILKLDRWKSIESRLDEINNGKALILLGGPAIVEDLYPGIYPLVPNLNDIKVPIIGMGLGATLRSYNNNKCNSFKFYQTSTPLLQRLSKDHKWFSVRDYITDKILKNNGVGNTLVTGCPAWFNLETLGKPVKCDSINTVTFAPGMGHFSSKDSFSQQINVMKLMKIWFSKSKKVCVFQDSLGDDDYKTSKQIKTQTNLSKKAQELGFEVVNCTYNLANMIDIYKQADFLVSYRVHSHVCMLTFGKPSILISEDSRGYGFSDFVGLKIFSSFDDRGRIIDGYSKPGLRGKVIRKALPLKINPYLLDDLRCHIEQLLDNNFITYAGIHNVILKYYKRMERFVQSIPS